VCDQRLLVAQALYIQIDVDAQRRVLAGHGVHVLPFGNLPLQFIAIREYDVELVRISRARPETRDSMETYPFVLLLFAILVVAGR